MRIGRLLLVSALFPVALVGTTSVPTAAGPPGTWTKVSTGSLTNIDQPGLYRTPDKVLHVVYHRDAGPSAAQYAQTSINAAGKIVGQSLVLSGWNTLTHDPRFVAGPGGGLRLVFSGLRTTTTVDPGSEGYVWTSTGTAAGTGWSSWNQSFGTGADAASGYASYGTGVVTLADGTPMVAWVLNNALYWKVGVDTNPVSKDTAGSTRLHTSLVRDGTNVYAAWYDFDNVAARNGIFVKRLLPSVGPTTKAPGSSTTSLGSPASLNPDQPVAMAVRRGGGTYVAYCVGYPTCTAMKLWKVGTAQTWTVPGSKSATKVALAAAPGGRLWVAFTTSDGKVKAVRTNTSATAFGVLRTVGRPTSQSTYNFAIEGSTGRGDIVVNNGSALFHTQVLAGLKLVATPMTWNGDSARTVKFRVTDAGQAVGGAKVAAGGRSCMTTAAGACSITFGKSGPKRFTAVATKAGYWKATVTLRIT